MSDYTPPAKEKRNDDDEHCSENWKMEKSSMENDKILANNKKLIIKFLWKRNWKKNNDSSFNIKDLFQIVACKPSLPPRILCPLNLINFISSSSLVSLFKHIFGEINANIYSLFLGVIEWIFVP